MKTYKAISVMSLIGETILEVKHNNPVMDKLPPYNAYTLITASGREFVIWNSYGQTCLNEIIEKKQK